MKGIAARSKKLLVAPGITTRNEKLLCHPKRALRPIQNVLFGASWRVPAHLLCSVRAAKSGFSKVANTGEPSAWHGLGQTSSDVG